MDKTPPAILIVDDTGVNQKMLQSMLRRLGYDTLLADSGSMALGFCEEGLKIDLILMDYMMPKMSGAETIQKIQEFPRYKNVPILGVSANLSEAVRIEMLERGAVDFLPRPIEFNELKIKIANHLKIRFLNREIEEKNRVLSDEMESARKIQEQLLPKPWPGDDSVWVRYGYHPCIAVGGDYLDYYRSPDGAFSAAVADVSGHGVHAAMTAAMVKTLFDVFRQYFLPMEILAQINERLFRILPEGNYVSACQLILPPASGQALIYNAGHPPPILLRKKTGLAEAIDNGVRNRFLGIFEEFRITPISIPFEPGDLFLLYTDGLLDAVSGIHKSYHPAPLIKFINNAGGFKDPALLYGLIRRQLNDYAKNGGRTGADQVLFEDDAAFILCGLKN